MALIELLLRVADAFLAGRIRFFLIGGMAVSTWVDPRLTRDVDIVVSVRRRDAPRLKKALWAAAVRATALEMRLLFERKFVRFQTGGPLLDIRIQASAHDRIAAEHAQPILVEDRKILVAAPEDLILYKLQAWRLQDQEDIRRLCAGISDLKTRYIESWLRSIGRATGAPMEERWDRVRDG